MSPYIEDLLRRMDAYVKVESARLGEGATYHPMHPVTLMAEAKVALRAAEMLAEKQGLGEYIQ
jgi:hypothetical protein